MQMQSWHENAVGWVVYKLAIGSCKQHFQTWKTSSFMNASQNYYGHFTGSNLEYTLSEPTAIAHSTDWLHLDACLPWNMLYLRPQDSSSRRHLQKRFCYECHSAFWTFLLDHTNRVFLSPVQWHNADWLHLHTFPPIWDALPLTHAVPHL